MTDKLVILAHFLSIYHPENSENQNFGKTGKKTEPGCHHFTNVYQKIMII